MVEPLFASLVPSAQDNKSLQGLDNADSFVESSSGDKELLLGKCVLRKTWYLKRATLATFSRISMRVPIRASDDAKIWKYDIRCGLLLNENL